MRPIAEQREERVLNEEEGNRQRLRVWIYWRKTKEVEGEGETNAGEWEIDEKNALWVNTTIKTVVFKLIRK